MPTVTAQFTLLDDAEADTDWVQIGSGPGLGDETDFVYQDTQSISIRGNTGLQGLALSDNALRPRRR